MPKKNLKSILAVVVGLAVSASHMAQAGTIWDGGGINQNINTVNNWDNNTLPDLTNGTASVTFGTGRDGVVVNTSVSFLGITINRQVEFRYSFVGHYTFSCKVE